MSLLSRLAVSAARAYGILSSKSTNVSASYLVVAGGGSGGSRIGGGGGAGGYLTSTATLSTLTTYTVTVGAGGASAISVPGTNGNQGSNSVLSGTGLTTVTATGGGYGGAYISSTGQNGGSGGSGGGAGGYNGGLTGGTGTSGQGYAGGNGASLQPQGGGGGGSGAVGSNATALTGGNGGAGTASSISGSSVTYAGGGGGSADSPATAGTGGSGGGGAGSRVNLNATDGTANTGGGGGGARNTGDVSNVASGAGGSGIVIISYTSATPKFVGGTLTTSGGNQIHTFTSSGTLSPLTPVTASYLVVAGGAGGSGEGGGGGGGAGGLLTSSTTLYSGATYVVTVGAGGAGSLTTISTSGSNSVLSGTGITTITSTGGGYGGWISVGGNGGSGGGGKSTFAGGTGTSGQGNNGGAGALATYYIGGGGGGAGAVGGNAVSGVGGNGGTGTASSISGSSVTYAGGGGGGTDNRGGGSYTAGTGGTGGGGNGTKDNTTGGAGTANTGGGGGGGGYASGAGATGGAGGSGVVIISYAGSQVFNGGLVTSSGGNTIHTFNATGALTPLTNNLNNSLRFRASASATLTRTPTIASNRTTWTWSGWVKLGQLSTNRGLFVARTSASATYTITTLTSSDTLGFYDNNGATLVTTQVFRDPSAWYHIVYAVDTTQATAANRVQLYINGNQVTSFSTATYPTQNVTLNVNAVATHTLGDNAGASQFYDGYMADINFVDGQQLAPYYFGNNDANQVWKPILYKGTYGTNGFYLTFADTSALTTSSNAGLGKDTSGNGNYWTTNNISITAGTTYDAMLDVPTNTSATVANYCTLNPLNKNTNVTVSNANLTSTSAVSNAGISGTMYVKSSGKYYWEATCTTKTTYPIVGIVNEAWSSGTNALTYPGATSGSYGYANDGLKYNNGSTASYGASYTSSDIIGVALDLDAGTLTFYKNNTSQGTAYTGLTDSYAPSVSGQASDVWNMNFGQRPFTYTPPTGFVALNTYNLPTPTILQGNKYMDATLYTGTNVSNTIVNQAQFQPDLVWIKSRSNASTNNYLTNSNAGRAYGQGSNITDAQYTSGASNDLTAFNSNGFSLGAISQWNCNDSGYTFVGWQWQAGQGTNTSNTSGSITSTVSASTTAGFSVVTYTGTGANATVGHGLGVAPAMIIFKQRNAVRGWPVYHKSLGASTTIYLNVSNASNADSTIFNATSPTSSVFSLGASSDSNNGSMLAYCWAEIVGFSKFGSYTGNGSTDGPFVYTGFRPKFIIYKLSSAAGEQWIVFDTARTTYNIMGTYLHPSLSNAESTFDSNDFLSNGFKIRVNHPALNTSGATYIYMAFAENPFKNANAR